MSTAALSTKLPAVLLVGAVVLTLLAFIFRRELFQPRVMHHPPSCVSNLKNLDGAVQQWASEVNQPRTETYSLTNPAILQWLRGSVLPKCPQGGIYSPGPTIADAPVCSVPGHSL
jgi:hypothetical protein